MRTFKPQEWIGQKSPGVIAEVDVTASEKERINEVAERVKKYLRDKYSYLFARSLMSQKSRDELLLIISDYIKAHIELHVPGVELKNVIKTVQNEVCSIGPITEAFLDPTVSNIDVNSAYDIYIEQNGEEVYRPDLSFQSEEHLKRVIDKMLLNMGKPALSPNEPHMDSLFEGMRICAWLGIKDGGISLAGVGMSLRKFSSDVFTSEEMIKAGTMSREMDEFFAAVLPASSAVIGGSTNAGKSSTLARIPLYMPQETRIITIEDSPELLLRDKKAYTEYRNIVSFITKDHIKPEKRYGIDKLVKVSLRARPWKIIIGEVRDSASTKMALEAMNTGHDTYYTIHAASARDVATRILQMCSDGNEEAIAPQIASCIDLIIYQRKILRSRIITDVVELESYDGKRPVVREIFKFVQTGITEDGWVRGYHQRVGTISERLAEKMKLRQVPEADIQRWLALPESTVSGECT